MEPNPELRGFIDADGKIKSWPSKQAKQFLLLDMLGEKFEAGKEYNAQEINKILNMNHTFNDPALLRRELITRKILQRSPDGRSYWKMENSSNSDYAGK